MTTRTNRERQERLRLTDATAALELLRATVEGVSASFITQPLEWHDLRWPLRDPMSGNAYVQMVLRLGYGRPGSQTPRRPVHDVLDLEP